jgi:excisionase family DNA binding protein
MEATGMTAEQWGASPDEAAALLGLKRRTFYQLVMPYVYSGVIQSAKIGRLRRIDVESLRAWWRSRLAVE